MDAAHYGRETKDKDMDNDFDIRQETLSSAEKEYENALRPPDFVIASPKNLRQRV